METERAKRLAGFVSWVGANIKGDEKGEAQVFLDRFFQAFGHAGLKEAGARLEERMPPFFLRIVLIIVQSLAKT